MGKGTLNSIPTDAAVLSFEKTCSMLGVNPSKGLNETEVLKRREVYGLNCLPEEKGTPFWKLVLAQFNDTLVQILLAAAAVSFSMAVIENNPSDFVEPFIILLILTLNGMVGVWQENKAEEAIEALKKYAPENAHVLRDSTISVIRAEDIVPGDIVEVSVGNRVPADLRLGGLHSTTLRVDQSILTGESKEVIKDVNVEKSHSRFSRNQVYSGTSVVYGKAFGVAVRTGPSTEIGLIERNVREQEDEATPLQKKLDEFGVLLSKVIAYICLLVFVINIARWFQVHEPSQDEGFFERYISPSIHSLKVAVALAVAAIPEGLPAVVTTCLALGTQRMARHNAIVRVLPSVETLGRCTVICSDKTGTLTTNKMSVQEIVTVENRGALKTYSLENTEFEPRSGCVKVKGKYEPYALLEDTALEMLTAAATLCNDASLFFNKQTNHVEKIGESTEAALLVMSEKVARLEGEMSSEVNTFRSKIESIWTKKCTLEFTRSRKSMSVLCYSKQKAISTLFVKGAPEELLKRSTRVILSNGEVIPLTKAIEAKISEKLQKSARLPNGLRCMGFAFRPFTHLNDSQLGDPSKFEEIETELVFAGFCGMSDPPRPEVFNAIMDCRTAGIRVVVITGDKKETAEAVCQKIGLLNGSDENVSFTGDDLDNMSQQEKRKIIHSAVLFSRTDPSHKLELVKLLQDEKLVCAMTGDGVNDSPALKKADIGISMGSGTEVAKSASNMVLADDNFATIVNAVREGRSIFNNTKQFIRYLISSNIGEVACVLFTGLLGFPEALTPIQLLWVNLVTDGLPATALGFNPPDPDIMEQPPRSVDEPIVNGWLFVRYMIIGVYVGAATVAGFIWWFFINDFTWTDLSSFASCSDMSTYKCQVLSDPKTARSIALSILVVIEMLNALNALSENQSIVVIRPSSNVWLIVAIASSLLLHIVMMYVPFFADIFGITPLGVDPTVLKNSPAWSFLVPTDFHDWKMVLVLSIPVIFIDEAIKYIARSFSKRKKTSAVVPME